MAFINTPLRKMLMATSGRSTAQAVVREFSTFFTPSPRNGITQDLVEFMVAELLADISLSDVPCHHIVCMSSAIPLVHRGQIFPDSRPVPHPHAACWRAASTEEAAQRRPI